MAILDDIVAVTRGEVAQRRSRRPLNELQRMVRDAPPVRSLRAALLARFSLIAEVKERSPSSGSMNPTNVSRALGVYESTQAVSAISILTQQKYFGGSLDRLWQSRQVARKP